LRKDRIKVGFADDRCWAAGSIRAAAIRNRVRQVILNEVPLGTTVGELCDHIRGGGLERIVFVPERRVAVRPPLRQLTKYVNAGASLFTF
jgi:hypothetical protein